MKRFLLSAVLLFSAYNARALDTPTTGDYLQYACWTHAANAERLERVSALVTSRVTTPQIVAANDTVQRTAPVLSYMRRVTFCSSHTLVDRFTEPEARQMYESAEFLVRVSYFLDGVYGEGKW
jgi:hypothetical protein